MSGIIIKLIFRYSGSEEFVGEIEQDLAVVKGAVVLLDAQKGVEVGTERVWDELRTRHTLYHSIYQ
ncbi:MAG: GTP-binding protein [Christensenellales bacterium]